MATGLALPVGVDNQGGAKIVSGDENDSKIIRCALGDDDNENAFQQNIGLGVGSIFGVSDELIRSKILRRLNEVFRRFQAQKRFILRPNTIKWVRDENQSQELTLEFRYVSIESDEEKLFRQNFDSSSGSLTGNTGG
jgi:hypothetical protein